MAFKLVILLLGTMLFVQNSFAAPAPHESSEEIGENPFKGVIERFKLIEITLDELEELHKLILEKGKPVFKKVLEDPQVTEVKTEEMKENVAKIQKFVDILEKKPSETESKIFEMLDEFGEIVTKFDKDENENLSDDEEIVEKSLKENGMEDFRSAIVDNFKTFFAKFIKEIESYIEGLNETEKKSEEKLITWFGKLKEEKDVEKQFDLLDNFFTDVTEDSSSESKE